jgi:hypothetical protein
MSPSGEALVCVNQDALQCHAGQVGSEGVALSNPSLGALQRGMRKDNFNPQGSVFSVHQNHSMLNVRCCLWPLVPSKGVLQSSALTWDACLLDTGQGTMKMSKEK